MEGETGEVDSPTEGDWQCTDQTGDSVAPDLRVGKTLEAVDPNTIEGVDIRVGLAYYFMKLDLEIIMQIVGVSLIQVDLDPFSHVAGFHVFVGYGQFDF